MLVDPDLLVRARKDHRDAVIEVMSMQYPALYRMAHALAGRADVANGVVQFVMRRAFAAIDHWKDEAAPQRWFRHHAIITIRRATKHAPTVETDTLVPAADREDARYVAFVRALRRMHYQQREAFLLHYGEKLDTRALATTMDLSTTAAQQHLKSATDTLRELAGAEIDSLTARVVEVYAALAPEKDLVLSRVSRGTRRFLWPRRLARVLRAVLVIVFLFLLAYVAVKWWRDLYEFFKDVLNH
jgi:RNA polymerase sigma factor (sigma-70 family)